MAEGSVPGGRGFCRWRMLRWYEAHGVGYIVGIARNRRLLARFRALMDRAAEGYRATGRKQRLFGSVWYGARTGDHPRRVIVKAEHSARGATPRFVVTHLGQTDRYLYDRMYCARGDMENRIKGTVEGGTPVRPHQEAVRIHEGAIPRSGEERSSAICGLCAEQPGDGETGSFETKSVETAGQVRLKNGNGGVSPAVCRSHQLIPVFGTAEIRD